MKKLTAKYVSQYYANTAKKSLVFVYEVRGSKDALEAYKILRGENYSETDKGVALYHTVNWNGANIGIILTVNGKIVVDTSYRDQSFAILKDRSVTSNPLVLEHLSKIVAEKYFDSVMGSKPAAPSYATPVTVEEDQEDTNTPPPPPPPVDPEFEEFKRLKAAAAEKAAATKEPVTEPAGAFEGAGKTGDDLPF